MNPTEPAPPAPPRRRRRWPRAVAAVAALLAALVGSAPWLLSTPAGNRWVGRGLARAFAPGRLRFASIRFSWTRPTRLSDVALDDPTGRTVVTAPSATLTAGLWGLVTRPERPGTLDLHRSHFEVERRPDGTIDLAEALAGIFSGRDPLRDLAIRADAATLRLRAPRLPGPLAVDRMDLLVELHPEPMADSWRVDLKQAAGPGLRLRGTVDRWKRPGSPADLAVDVRADGWPIASKAGDLDVRATLDGTASAHRSDGRWRTEGTARVAGLLLSGGPLGGDRVDLATLDAAWSIALGPAGPSIDRFEATAPVGRVSAVVPDLADASHPARIEGDLDLAALARQLPHLLGLEGIESGRLTLAASSKPGGDRSEWTLDARLADLAWTADGTRRESPPAGLTGRATYRPDGRRLDVAELALSTPYLSLRAGGRLDDLGESWTVDLSGSIAPDYGAIAKLLADRVEPGAKLVGGPSPFRLKGPVRGPRGLAGLEVEGGVRLDEADLFGMKVGPASVVVRSREGRLAVDPIETRLNDGRLHLEPAVDLDAPGGPVVRLGKESTLAGAEVNEEVSSRVLSYVAPVLDRTTRASGRVSAAIDRATFPVGGDPSRRANVTGRVVFEDVEFAPSPLAREVVAMVAPRRELTTLHLDQPVLLTIADGRVHQRGLAVPIGDVARVEVEGWVGFDKSLGLTATVPVSPSLFPNAPALNAIVAGTTIRVPIGGTLDAPKLDKAAFNAELKELGKSLLVRGAGVGALELLNRLAQPRDPNAPPPPTAEERKARRMERRNDRRRARGLDPLPMPGDRP